MGKGCTPGSVQFGSGCEGAIYSPPLHCVLGKALVNVQGVKPAFFTLETPNSNAACILLFFFWLIIFDNF